MEQIYDVAIVGGGPVGVFTANLLAKSGHSVCVIERDAAPYSLPRAVHVDHEMLRLFGDLGLLDQLKPMMRAGDGHMHIGADKGVIRFLSAAGKPRPFGHANDYFFFQPELERVLREGLARFDKATLSLGASVDGLTQSGDAVSLTLDDGTNCFAHWVIGCDGARSIVRKSMGIHLDDLNFEEPWLVVDAEVEGPIQFPEFWGVPEGANLQNLSVMLCDPERPATIVPGRGTHRRWEFMLLPDENDEEMAAPARVADMVKDWVGDTPHKIIRAATYRFHGLVAEDWRSDRVFLAGDAAHQTPPFFGQGLCHGLRDGANLAWKLGLVLDGHADEDLLDTYQIEREAQVRHVISRAVEVGRSICELDPNKAKQRDEHLRSQAGMKTAAELIVPLVSPLIGDTAGERFINPTMGEGVLLDDAVGVGWRLFHRADAPLPHADWLEALEVKMVNVDALSDPKAHLRTWFENKPASYALVRPDHYLALHALTPSDLDKGLSLVRDTHKIKTKETG